MNAPALAPRIDHYTAWLEQRHGLAFADYDALWRWSTTDLDTFWQSIWDYFELESPAPHRCVLERDTMPGAVWFPGAQVSFARQVLRHADAAHAAGHPAVVFADEREPRPRELTWPELRRRVAVLAGRLRELGVQRGDRVAAWMPNAPEALVAFLASASLGAIWSVCSPDMGPVAVLDRFRQIEPKVLFAVDGQTWAGSTHDRRAVLHELLAGLPSLRHLVLHAAVTSAVPSDFAGPGRGAHAWADLIAGTAPQDWQPDWLPFDHPLWIVYSSGTTGLPKPIVHGHGGIVLEMLKGGALHNDVRPSAGPQGSGERFHWFSSTGWIMWNAQVGALLGGTTVCLYDGNPGGAGNRDWGTLWRFAAAAGVTWFGAGAAFFASCLKADVEPMREGDLSRLRAIGSTGSPLSDECYEWIWARLPRAGTEAGSDRIWIDPISGGTDFAGAFVAGLRTLPVHGGEMQCRCLGAAVAAWSEDGRERIDEVGELVCTRPMPSMPLYFWNDPDGRRYRESYFDMFPGGDGRPAAWRHGDWIRIVPRPGAHGAVIYGRSDATINRHGIRMGTAELYRAVEALPEVLDSLVVDLEYLGRESYMPLFVVLRDGLQLDAALDARIRNVIRGALSPRHVPSEVLQVAAVPRTLSGKKMELPVKKLLMGADPSGVLKRDAMANAESIDWFVGFAARRNAAADPR